MAEGIDTVETGGDALGVVTMSLVAQAFALDQMFFRAAKEAFSTEVPFPYHARKALKAQARCRATLKVLLALRAAAQAVEKFSNFDGGSIRTLKTISLTNGLPRSEKPVSPHPTGHPKRRALRNNRWTPERRARQAAAIRGWQPWRTSTGPKTHDGKARSARNALRHGLRSKVSVEARREDRRILAVSADNLAIARVELGRLRLRAQGHSATPTLPAMVTRKTNRQTQHLPERPGGFHSIDIGRSTPALIPSAPANYRGIAARRHPPPVRPRAPRRRWRIAS